MGEVPGACALACCASLGSVAVARIGCRKNTGESRFQFRPSANASKTRFRPVFDFESIAAVLPTFTECAEFHSKPTIAATDRPIRMRLFSRHF